MLVDSSRKGLRIGSSPYDKMNSLSFDGYFKDMNSWDCKWFPIYVRKQLACVVVPFMSVFTVVETVC